MKLFFFTGTYPYGPGEQWKKNELDILVNHFDEITIIPYSFGGNFDNPKQLPKGVKLEQPLFRHDGFILNKTDIHKILFHKYSIAFVTEFFAKKVYTQKAKVVDWMQSTLNIIKLLSHPTVKQVLNTDSAVLYFFWGRGAADVLPFINTTKYKKVLVRMHRFDLFEYTSNNYIPYRSRLMTKKEILIAPCSDIGKQHLLDLYPAEKGHVRTVRLGTRSNSKKSKISEDGILRIYSCSNITTVKRIHIMIESLRHIDIPVIWKHIGDGPLMNEMKELVEKCGLKDKFLFEGFVNTDTINELYTNNAIDLFVNTSSSEGVPVSIMEAFAAGIPVLATNVGGTSEIVDDTVGKILPESVNPQELANSILAYARLDNIEKGKIRENAYKRFADMSNSEVLTKELVSILTH
jgi:glycosyltransferase involved in cell wall biosynthesis